MIEHERCTLSSHLDHALGEKLVLLHDDLLVLFGEGAGRIGWSDHRLHAEPCEAEPEHGVDVLHEIGVVVSEGAADVILLFSSRGGELSELGDDDIKAAHAARRLAEAVVDLLPPVQTHDDVVHLAVAELDDVVIHQHPVGGEGEAEVLAALLFPLARVRHDVLHHAEVHERLAPEEVHFEVVPAPGIFNEEIYGAFADVKRHESAFAVIFALACETIVAVEVAGVRDMQTQRLDHGIALCKHAHIGTELILGKQRARAYELADVGKALRGIVRSHAAFCRDCGDELLIGHFAVE